MALSIVGGVPQSITEVGATKYTKVWQECLAHGKNAVCGIKPYLNSPNAKPYV